MSEFRITVTREGVYKVFRKGKRGVLFRPWVLVGAYSNEKDAEYAVARLALEDAPDDTVTYVDYDRHGQRIYDVW